VPAAHPVHRGGRHGLRHAHRHRRHRAEDRVALDVAALDQEVHRIHQGHVGTGDGRGAGAAIGLQHVAIERDGALAERAAVDAGTQGAADQALDLQRAAALLAAGGFAVVTGVGRTRQHAVLGGHPAFALATQEARHAVFHAGRAQHAGLAEADQDRALGVTGEGALDAHFAQLVGLAAAGTGISHAQVPVRRGMRGHARAGDRRARRL